MSKLCFTSEQNQGIQVQMSISWPAKT